MAGYGDDPILGCFAKSDPLIEILLSLWANPVPYVLLVAEVKKRLPGVMVEPHLLANLAAQSAMWRQPPTLRRLQLQSPIWRRS